MTAEQLEQLTAMIGRMYEMAAFYAPHYAQKDVDACWHDIRDLLGIEAEALAMARARECQAGLPAEFWSPV
jgi:hypothetical protein